MSREAPVVWVVAGPGVAERWACFLWMQGRRAFSVPWSEVHPSADPAAVAGALAAGSYDLVLFTSAHAPESLPVRVGEGRPCACVGPWTARAAAQRGFRPILVGRAGAEALAREVLAAQPAAERVLFLRGRDARPEAPAVLRAAGVVVDEVVAYAVEPSPHLARVLAALPPPAVVVFGSPLAVEAMHDVGGAFENDVRFVAPGAATAQRAATLGTQRVFSMDRPGPSGAAAAVSRALRKE